MALSLASAVAFTGCIKNEEADGIKALREAQAELILAKANAETSDAANRAALAQAQVLIDQATAAWNEAQAKAIELQNELAESNNALVIAQNEAAIAQIQATAEYELQIAIAEAETLLANQKMELEAALQELAAQIVGAGEDVSSVAQIYYEQYVEALDQLSEVQQTVLGWSSKIAEATYYVGDVENGIVFNDEDGDGINDNFVEYISNKKDLLDKQITWMTAYATTVNTLIDQAKGDNAEAIATATAQVSTFEDEIETKRIEAVNQKSTYEIAYEEMQEAYEAYNDALAAHTTAAWFTDEASVGTKDIDGFYIEDIINDPSYIEIFDGSSISLTDLVAYANDGSYHSIPFYEVKIAENEDLIDDIDEAYDRVEDLYNVYKNQLDDLYEAYVDSEEPLVDLLQAWNIAKLEEETYTGGEASVEGNLSDATDAAEQAYEDAVDARNDAWKAYSDFINDNINLADIVNATEAIDGSVLNNIYGGVITTNEAEIVGGDIQALMAELEGDKAAYEAEIENYEIEITIVEAYILYLETEKNGTLTEVEALKVPYFTAKDSWVAAKDTYNAILDELEVLEVQLDEAENILEILLQDDTTGIVEDLVDALEDINESIAELSDESVQYDIALTNAAAYLEYLQKQLVAAEESETEAQAIVDDLKALLDAELGE